jgi:hypothetical protein
MTAQCHTVQKCEYALHIEWTFLPERYQVILNIENISALLQDRRRIILPVYVTLVQSFYLPLKSEYNEKVIISYGDLRHGNWPVAGFETYRL